jgi:hypothetical protein
MPLDPEYGFIYDVEDIPALIAFGDIQHLLAEARRRPERLRAFNPQSDSDRHLVETGHRLEFGCCARRDALPFAS